MFTNVVVLFLARAISFFFTSLFEPFVWSLWKEMRFKMSAGDNLKRMAVFNVRFVHFGSFVSCLLSDVHSNIQFDIDIGRERERERDRHIQHAHGRVTGIACLSVVYTPQQR